MKLVVTPGCSLIGETTLPGDKSLSHRAALFAALAEGDSIVENFLVSGVTRAMLGALSALGVPWELEGSRLTVHGRGLGGLQAPQEPLDCGSSATTLRLLAGALAAAGIPAVLDGSEGLRRRPMGRIVEPLQAMGVPIVSRDGCAPLVLQARSGPLRPLDASLPVASAQVKTCLLLAALAAEGATTLREPGLSRDHSERMLGSMGVSLSSQKVKTGGDTLYQVRLEPPRPLRLRPLKLSLPGDFSSAAFLMVAALITPGSKLKLKGVGLNPGRTGLLDALLAMGAKIRISAQATQHGEPVGDLSVQHSFLHSTVVKGELVARMIDEFPVFAVAAAYAGGTTVVSEAAELRHKESDRITALTQELSSLGVDVHECPDGFVVRGGQPLRGGSVQPHGDHRLAMSLAVAGLATGEPVTVEGAEITHESFPEFAGTLRSLGAQVEEH